MALLLESLSSSLPTCSLSSNLRTTTTSPSPWLLALPLHFSTQFSNRLLILQQQRQASFVRLWSRSTKFTSLSPVASVGGLLGGIFKGGTDTGEATRTQYADIVTVINRLEAKMSSLSDSQLREKTSLLQQRARESDISLDSLLPEAFAVVREASKRVLGLRPFDVQLKGGGVLHKGEIAEMRTGEGKTLVAILPAYSNALTGKGVHVVTVKRL